MSNDQHYENDLNCEFAMAVQYLINKGWKLVEIEYGDRRFDIDSRLIIERGSVQRKISPNEIETIAEED
jgi:hypothetical protein